MTKKLKSRCGTSIAEMLVAVIVLALLTAGGITATSAVMASYIRMKEAAHADILASTVFEALSNEIRLGWDIALPTSDPAKTTSESLTLTSACFGEDTALKLENGHLIAQKDGEPKQVLSDSAYNGLHLDDLSFEEVPPGVTPAGSGGGTSVRAVYKISFTVCNGSDSALWKGSASTAPMLEPPL